MQKKQFLKKLSKKVHLSNIPVVFSTAWFAQRPWVWPRFQPQWQTPGGPWRPQPGCGWGRHSSRGCRGGAATTPPHQHLRSGWRDGRWWSTDLWCSRRRWHWDTGQPWSEINVCLRWWGFVGSAYQETMFRLGNGPDEEVKTKDWRKVLWNPLFVFCLLLSQIRCRGNNRVRIIPPHALLLFKKIPLNKTTKSKILPSDRSPAIFIHDLFITVNSSTNKKLHSKAFRRKKNMQGGLNWVNHVSWKEVKA